MIDSSFIIGGESMRLASGACECHSAADEGGRGANEDLASGLRRRTSGARTRMRRAFGRREKRTEARLLAPLLLLLVLQILNSSPKLAQADSLSPRKTTASEQRRPIIGALNELAGSGSEGARDNRTSRIERNLDEETSLPSEPTRNPQAFGAGDQSDTPIPTGGLAESTSVGPTVVAGASGGRQPSAAERAPGKGRKSAAGSSASGNGTSTSKRSAGLARVSESELLPLSDFNVQQPPFAELIKSWPPTSLHHLTTESPGQAAGHARQPSQALQATSGRTKAAGSFLWGSLGGQEQPEGALARNHLNEDLDDTIVTADESFEQDQLEEPATWVNYLGEMGDFIYGQLRQHFQQSDSSPPASGTAAASRREQSLKLELIDELLDDYFYDQYQNSQVLYYGPQLVREGDIFEIGCYMPNEQPAEWTKNGRPLESESASASGGSGARDDRLESENNPKNNNRSPRVIRRSDFLGAKQNFSLKIFEASLADKGNYRCNKMSRKFHKLVVVPLKISTTQLFFVQQQLLRVVNPALMSLPESSLATITAANYQRQLQRKSNYKAPISVSSNASGAAANGRSSSRGRGRQEQAGSQQWSSKLLPGQLIVENQPLTLDCNISDEQVLRRLAENPKFLLAWFKNGRQIKATHHQAAAAENSALVLPSSAAGRTSQVQARQALNGRGRKSAQAAAGGRFQLAHLNGRQLLISAAQFSDAGDYLCSWYQLPALRQAQAEPEEEPGQPARPANSAPSEPEEEQPAREEEQQHRPENPLAAGNLLQLMAPVKLRPFKSAYHVRQGNELRLVCQAQRAYPAAQISWYIGNRLIDAEFLREHSNEFRIMNLNSEGVSATDFAPSSGGQEDTPNKQVVEINPIPSSKQQLHLTARGSWVEYKEPSNERYQIESAEQQQRYLHFKLAQLTGGGGGGSGALQATSSASLLQAHTSGAAAQPGALSALAAATQTSLSILVVNKLNIEKHSSRYACRATTRANSDEVTTVVRVQASSMVVVRPSSGRATLVPGQPLHFQCEFVGRRDAQFLWFKRPMGYREEEDFEDLIEPLDGVYQVHNDRMTVLAPTKDSIGDYVCRLKDEQTSSYSKNDFAIIKVRSTPFIDEFELGPGQTGKSYTLTDGERLELLCRVRDRSAPVNITWLRSQTPDDERTMVPITSEFSGPLNATGSQLVDANGHQTFLAPDQGSVLVESVDEFSKRLVIESVRLEHRSYYVCMADNGVTERTRKVIFLRVKDKFIALWPFLGIVSEIFILFTIIHSWETFSIYQRVPTS